MGNIKNEAAEPHIIEPSLDRLITALCDDYSRRERILREGGFTPRGVCELRYLNSRILEVAEELALEEGGAFIEDIGGRVGYVNSDLNYMSESAYKRRKAEIKRNIAKRLYLIG